MVIDIYQSLFFKFLIKFDGFEKSQILLAQ